MANVLSIEDQVLVLHHLVEGTSIRSTSRVTVDLASRINLPRPTDTGERAGCIRQISTDGLNVYPEAVDLGFGAYCRYGQIIKDYRNADQPGATDPRKWSGRIAGRYSATSRYERYACHTSSA